MHARRWNTQSASQVLCALALASACLLCARPALGQSSGSNSGVAAWFGQQLDTESTRLLAQVEAANTDKAAQAQMLARDPDKMITEMIAKCDRYNRPLAKERFTKARDIIRSWKLDAAPPGITLGKVDMPKTPMPADVSPPNASTPAASPSPSAPSDKDKAGFFTGLWHGALAPFRFVASFIWDIDVWSKNNTGVGYAGGFILGVLMIFGGGGSSARR